MPRQRQTLLHLPQEDSEGWEAAEVTVVAGQVVAAAIQEAQARVAAGGAAEAERIQRGLEDSPLPTLSSNNQTPTSR